MLSYEDMKKKFPSITGAEYGRAATMDKQNLKYQ